MFSRAIILLSSLVAKVAFAWSEDALFVSKKFLSERRRLSRAFPVLLSAYQNEQSNSFDASFTNLFPRLFNFNRGADSQEGASSLATTGFQAVPKIEKLPLGQLAQMIDKDLYETEWFVTGRVNPKYFAPDFHYEDADVEFASLEDYARDVQALFDQDVSRAEVIETVVNTDLEDTITCTWRLSGKANLIPGGIRVKPFIVHTNFFIDRETGLIQRQEDRYTISYWDILLSALFPFLNGRLTAPEAPAVAPRIEVPDRDRSSPFDAWKSRAGIVAFFTQPVRPEKAVSSSSSVLVATKLEEEKEQEEEASDAELAPYSDLFVPKSSGTRPLTAVESSRLYKAGKSPFFAAVVSIQETMWDKLSESAPLPKPRMYLSDGTALPSIKAPTFMDRAKPFMPDRPDLAATLNEATRRNQSRRASSRVGRKQKEEFRDESNI